MARFFIHHPIVAIVISILTVLIGVVSMISLPVAQFPDIVPTQIMVQASYTGADAETVEAAVATPLEQQISGVDNMSYMYSLNANDGSMTINVAFELGTDPNMDQVLTQMRVGQAQAQLPQEVQAGGVTVEKSTASPLIVFAIYSPEGEYDETFLANYCYINLADQFTRVYGISRVQIFGAGQYAMRIWLDPDRLANWDITAAEVIKAIQNQNRVNPSGQVGAPPVPSGQEFTYSVRAQGRLQSEEEFGDIVVRAEVAGGLVRLSDVARIELGSNTYTIKGGYNGKPAAIMAVYQLPGTNALKAAEGALALMETASESFPDDMVYDVAINTTEAVTEGMKEIVHTLFEALALVILVVFIFLQGWRATLIPLLAVPVSLIGTFIFFPVFGFSINTLSLFGLVLAIGLVVDDAIVVVEAVELHIERGLAPLEATIKAMEEVSGPVMATALILAAVFVPTVFIPGITGQLYQQFAITIAVSVLISAFNALTLSPALCVLLLKPRTESKGLLQRFFTGFNTGFGKATNGYSHLCHFLIRKFVVGLVLLGVFTAGALFMGRSLPTGFIPDEDQGYVFVNIALPDAASLQRTSAVTAHVVDIVSAVPGVEKIASVEGYSMLSGVSTSYSGLLFVGLEPWSKRTAKGMKADDIINEINKRLFQLPAAQAFAFPPPAIPGIGASGGVTFVLEDRGGRTIAQLSEQLDLYMAAAEKRPELARVSTTFLPTVPQVFVDVDRDKVMRQGMDINAVYQTLQTYMGGYFVNYFNRFGRQWQVIVQAEGEFRTDIEGMTRFYVRSSIGPEAPLSAVVNTTTDVGPEFIMRFNLYRAAQINATAAPGFSSGQAMKAMEEVFAETMPRDMGYDYMGMSYQEKAAAEGVSPTVIFGLSLIFVFLILAALYESWSLPFSVLIATPIAVFGAFLALELRDMVNNVYAQIGLVMLIGLAAKNAILIVEFAKLELERGRTIGDAALEGAKLRLRPILMTSFAFILGCVPLAIASGSGAVSRQVLGTTVIGGMVFASLVAIFFVPLAFYLVESVTGGRKAAWAKRGEEAEMDEKAGTDE